MQRAVSWAAQPGSTPGPAPLVRIQQHPDRAALVEERLLPRLAGLPVEIVEHSAIPPDPLTGYRLCLAGVPDNYTHVLVIQDDAIPCRNLAAVLPLVAREVPVCLFLPNMAMRTRAFLRRGIGIEGRWVTIHHTDWVPVVAVLWPVRKVEHFLDWYEHRPPARHRETSDDAMVGRWMRRNSQTVLATFPSLVEHPDDVPSTWRTHRQPRRALNFIGDLDPLTIDW